MHSLCIWLFWIQATIEFKIRIKSILITTLRWHHTSEFILQIPVSAIQILRANMTIHHVDQKLVINEILRYRQYCVNTLNGGTMNSNI